VSIDEITGTITPDAVKTIVICIKWFRMMISSPDPLCFPWQKLTLQIHQY
jgi:hypothetical protein